MTVQTKDDIFMYKYNLDLIKRDCEFKYYFLGLVASDGYISSKSNNIELSFKASDLNLLKMIRDIICPGKKISLREKLNAYRLCLANKDLKKEIVKYINPVNKTFSLFFPYGIPEKHIRHFIRGYIDGDGNIGIAKARKKIANGQMKYYYGIRLRVLGTRAFVQGLNHNIQLFCYPKANSKPHKKGKENVYYAEYSFKSANKILDWIYEDATYFLERKKKVFQKISTLDNDTLAVNYNSPKGHYNTRSAKEIW